MSEKPQRDPQQTIVAISEQSTLVKDAATELSDRIELFTSWIGKLPGRVETTNYGKHPDDDGAGNLSFCLRLHRDGKEWTISYGSFHEAYNNDPENPVDWKPLSEAPVRIKLLAISQFPDLLESIAKSQKRLAKEIKAACTEFDDFAAKVGIDQTPKVIVLKGGK